MSIEAIHQRLQQHFPSLLPVAELLPEKAFSLVQLPAQMTVFSAGDTCEHYLLVTSGSVRVNMQTHRGKSLVLYRVGPGQSCIITTSCLMGCSAYPTFAETEIEVEALTLSKANFRTALDESSQFRTFVFDSMGQRLGDIMARLEAINFTPIDARLAQALLEFNDSQRLQAITHEALAEEIGTAREVVSRHLKKMQGQGLIKLGRGRIELLDQQKLAALCD